MRTMNETPMIETTDVVVQDEAFKAAYELLRGQFELLETFVKERDRTPKKAVSSRRVPVSRSRKKPKKPVR